MEMIVSYPKMRYKLVSLSRPRRFEVETKAKTRQERFAEALAAWRAQQPSPRVASPAVIAQQVADSMAFEGDVIDRRWLEERIAAKR